MQNKFIQIHNDDIDNEIKSLVEDIQDIHEITMMINAMTEKQKEGVGLALDNIEKTIDTVQNANVDIVKAKTYQSQYTKYKFGLLTLGMIGVGGPLSILFGVKLGIVSAVTILGMGGMAISA